MEHPFALLAAGSIALDTLEGPFGQAPDELGGSVLYFALAAALLTPVGVVAAVGRADEESVVELVDDRPIDTAGLAVLDAPTFRWWARHEGGGNVDLGREDSIYELWRPEVPDGFRGWLFAGSMRPALQLEVLRQASGAELRAADAMLSYTHTATADAQRVVGASTWFFANTGELHALGGEANAPDDFRLRHGLLGLCVKAGPDGARVLTEDGEVHVAALSSHPVVDTTGAGDALAAGFLARRLTAPEAGIRDALEHGVACASITIEDVGLRAIRRATPELLTRRLAEVRAPDVEGMRIEAALGDITQERVAAVVNAANQGLAGGGGVDGAIHRAAGARELQEACRRLGGCATGDAKATPGFALPAPWIIHAVGPRWQGGGRGEAELLASCYRRSLQVADELGARSIAFPAISTGIYGYPPAEAARIAVETLRSTSTQVELVRLVAFDQDTLELYRGELRRRAG